MLTRAFQFLIITLGLLGCASTASEITTPDYNQLSSWASLPGESDETRAAVFYIYPTYYFGLTPLNVDHQDQTVSGRVQELGVGGQMAAFSECCQLYAPLYRQASYMVFGGQPSGLEAMTLSYRDVEAAFQNFLGRLRPNQPFVIASHSQGTAHAVRLIAELGANNPLWDRLVAAYLVGFWLPEDRSLIGLQDFPLCDSATAIGCLISWDSAVGPVAPEPRKPQTYWNGDDGYGRWLDQKSLCINPLTWRAGGQAISQNDSDPIPVGTRVTCDPATGLLLASEVSGDAGNFFQSSLNRPRILHRFDFYLYQRHIKENVAARIAAWRKRGSKDYARSAQNNP